MIDFETNSAQEILQWAIQSFESRFAIVTSFQAEGMVLLDLAHRVTSHLRVITLDTGRLPAETFEMMERVRFRYGVRVEIVPPDTNELSSMVTRFGPNLFLQEPALRNLCCEIRKVRPLGRKLEELSAYAVGLRREQSDSRQNIRKADEVDGRTKLSPLADWTRTAVWQYVRENDVPAHALYERGYQSIGCAPCTRAVAAGKDERSGRWWWENDAVKECGIHFSPDGQVQRKVDVMLSEVLPH